MKRIIISSLAIMAISSIALAETVSNTTDQEIKGYIEQLTTSLSSQKKAQNTYKWVISSEKGKGLVELINTKATEPITIATSDNNFCMMVKLSDGIYCTDDTGYTGNQTGCNKSHISCSEPKTITPTPQNTYTREQIIAMIKKILTERKATTPQDGNYGIKEDYFKYKEMINNIKTKDQFRLFAKEYLNGTDKDIEDFLNNDEIKMEEILQFIAGPSIPQDAIIKEYAQGQYGMLIITFFLDQDKNYYTINPLFIKINNKWTRLIDGIAISDKKEDVVINMPSSLYEKLIDLSIFSDKKEILKDMIKLGADINKTDEYGNSYLEQAIRWENLDIIKILLEAGINIYPSAIGDILIHIDSKESKIATIKEVMKYEKPDKINTSIDTALRYAIQSDDNDNEIIEELLSYISDKQKAYDSLLKNGVEAGNVKIVELAKAQGGDIKRIESYADLLLDAAKYGKLDQIKAALIAGIDIETKDDFDEKTALILASKGWFVDDDEEEEEYLEIVRFLIDSKANINAQDLYGNTALFIALEEGHFKIAQELIKRGADTKIKNSQGKDAATIIESMTELNKLIPNK